jgi:hypothetical protein
MQAEFCELTMDVHGISTLNKKVKRELELGTEIGGCAER